MKRVMIVEDHPIVLKGLSQLIAADPYLRVVALANSRAQALSLLAEANPDIAIVDLTLGKDSGLELIRDLRIQAPAIRILVLSMHNELHYADRAVASGAHGYCMKEQSADEILEAVRTVARGKTWFSQRFLEMRETDAASPGQLAMVLKLSDREFQIFGMTGQGLGTSEIAEQLSLSIKTIESHKENIKQKLKCATARDLRQYAAEWHASQNK
jgi:DNA-binding NarL/FixJ family response regulator